MTDNENHDFDFLMTGATAGEWNVTNRRLRKALVGSADWYEFNATLSFRHLLGGIANVDEFIAPELGMNGMTVRTFDVERKEWSIYWVNRNNGRLDTPVVGTFTDGVGTFLGPDVWDGTPILVRFLWDTTGPRPRWEQAFSTDDGTTWEPNWISEYTPRTS